MIAISATTSWLLIGLAVGTLWGLWGILSVIGDMLERWHERHRVQPATEGAGKPRKEKGSSTSP